jgi:hypothetical protein
MIEMMAALGVLGEYKGSQAREVMITLKDYENMRSRMEADTAPAQRRLSSGSRPSTAAEDMDEDDDSARPTQLYEGQRSYVAVDDEQ